jgi:hypothetical protein
MRHRAHCDLGASGCGICPHNRTQSHMQNRCLLVFRHPLRRARQRVRYHTELYTCTSMHTEHDTICTHTRTLHITHYYCYMGALCLTGTAMGLMPVCCGCLRRPTCTCDRKTTVHMPMVVGQLTQYFPFVSMRHVVCVGEKGRWTQSRLIPYIARWALTRDAQ